MTLHQPDIPTLERQTFVETFKYKLIYVYAIDDKKHEGYLKVGDTDVVSSALPICLVKLMEAQSFNSSSMLRNCSYSRFNQCNFNLFNFLRCHV